MFKKLSDKKYKDLDPKIISWQKKSMGNETPLLYIYPQLGDNIKKISCFAVKDYEKALFYSKGKLMGELGGGVYEIDKKARIKGTEIVWIDTSLLEIRWGVPQSNGIPTKDGHIIGLHGDLKLKITDVKTFYSEIVAGKKTWIIKDLRNWIISLLQTSMRDTFKNYEAKKIILEDRERVINLIISKITDEFIRYGLELESLNVLGIQSPEGMDALYRTEREKSVITDELDILKQKQELEAKKLEFESQKKAFEREQAELDAKAKLAEKKYLVEAEKLEKSMDVEILEKEQKARVAGDIAKIQAEGEKNVEIAKVMAEAGLLKEKETYEAKYQNGSKDFKIFLSYSTKDSEYFQIFKISERLKKFPRINNVLFWEKHSGENIIKYVERTLKVSNVFVLFCSENAARSKSVEDEWQAAFQLRKKGLLKIIPVYENEENIPVVLGHLLNVKYSKENFDQFIENLYNEIIRENKISKVR